MESNGQTDKDFGHYAYAALDILDQIKQDVHMYEY